MTQICLFYHYYGHFDTINDNFGQGYRCYNTPKVTDGKIFFTLDEIPDKMPLLGRVSTKLDEMSVGCVQVMISYVHSLLTSTVIFVTCIALPLNISHRKLMTNR